MQRTVANNSGRTNWSDVSTPSIPITCIGAFVMTVFLLVGILGTAWIVLVVLRQTTMRHNAINIFIASLCINDLLNLLLSQPMVLTSYYAHEWVLGSFLCSCLPELNMVLVATSLSHHALIAIHRYIVVVRSQYYSSMNKQCYQMLVIVGTRAGPVVLSALLLLTLNTGSGFRAMTEYVPSLLRCVYAKQQAIRILIVVVVTLLLPCLIVVVCFGFIFCFVHNLGRQSTLADRNRLKREIRITKMFGIVFAMFLIGYIPYGLVRMFDSGDSVTPDAYVVVTVMYAAASCMNPIIFGAMNTEIREACLQFINMKSTNVGEANLTNSRRALIPTRSAAEPGDGIALVHIERDGDARRNDCN